MVKIIVLVIVILLTFKIISQSPYKKKIATITLETASYNNKSVMENLSNDSKNSKDQVWLRTQKRKLSNITGLDCNGKKLIKDSWKNSQLLTSLTGVVGSKSPKFQTGRYVLMFDDFTSITFDTGFNSNYGFGDYKYTGSVHGIEGYKHAEIIWSSVASDENGTDKWTIQLM